MTAALRRLRDRTSGDDGFTLMELLVSMVLIGIIGTIVATAASQALRTNAAAEVAVSRSADAQTAMDRMTRSLRAAFDPLYTPATPTTSAVNTTGFADTQPFKVVYYTNLKNGTAGTCVTTNPTAYIPSQVTDQVVTDPNHTGQWMLTETIVPGSCTGSVSPVYQWTGAGTTRVLAYGLAAPGGSTPALFTYLRPTYFSEGTAAQVAVGASNCASTAPVAPTAAQSNTTGSATPVPLWVGAKPGVDVNTTVSSVIITLTLSGTGVNVPQNVNTSGARTVTTTSTVLIDSANDYTSRDGTCL